MSKNVSDKYYQENKERLEKKANTYVWKVLTQQTKNVKLFLFSLQKFLLKYKKFFKLGTRQFRFPKYNSFFRVGFSDFFELRKLSPEI